MSADCSERRLKSQRIRNSLFVVYKKTTVSRDHDESRPLLGAFRVNPRQSAFDSLVRDRYARTSRITCPDVSVSR